MAIEVNTKAALLAQLKTNAEKIKSFGVEKLGVFGSFSTDSVTKDSDIDLLIEFVPSKKNFDNFIDLSFYLEELFNRKVEIVTPQSLSKHIGPHILKQTQYVSI
ncbi:nucleotidyltransferase family protein [Pedobacter endophyticus]|uniref:Nucleotidyltransferase domain-containing protein n=1 Tax=Pedobacter endophyticus TaxID=2789740 RepID=A0A7S9PYE7_9SPHI|nr:nucleotidyltransferase domain-containing protein [Pedobacter endophyticus]QPH39158.1 nucleotidyltransferase domain-containing protein [Pedobacter endophyticus]